MTPREFLDILHVAERLKDTPRHCTTTKRRTESVAEHSWRISLMALLLPTATSRIPCWADGSVRSRLKYLRN